MKKDVHPGVAQLDAQDRAPSQQTIANKWPAARLVGPRVDPELALEFIRRTDVAFRYANNWLCNDHSFNAQFKRLVWGDMDWEQQEQFRSAWGYVSLEHLGSHWVASSWIGGPSGPVSPEGRVQLAKNFGKWPSAEGVERDLTILADTFPWLTFTLGLWDNGEEEATGNPDICWRLQDGQWRVTEDYPDHWPETTDMGELVRRLAFQPASTREVTWPVHAIERLWGDQIATARAQALSDGATTCATKSNSGMNQ